MLRPSVYNRADPHDCFLPIIGLIIFLCGLVQAAEIDVQGRYYQVGDEVKATVKFAPKERGNVSLWHLTGSTHTYSKRLSPKEGSVTFEALKRTNRGYSDWRVFQDTPEGGEDFFRVRQKDIKPIPGAISLHGGPEFNYGDAITFDVNVPKDKVHQDPPWETNFRYYVEYDIMPFDVTGSSYGQAALSRSESNNIKEANTRFDWTTDQYRGAKFAPGFYRIRLTENNQTVASQKFTVIAKPIPNALSLGGKTEFKVGDKLSFSVKKNTLKPHLKWHAFVYRHHEDGRAIPLGQLRQLEDYTERNFSPEFETAGNYVLQLLVEDYPNYYIMDQLSFKVTGQKPLPGPGQMFISVGHDPVFRQGEPITVTYNFTREPAKGRKIDLYEQTEHDRQKRREALQKDRETQGDKKIKSFDAVIGKREAFVIDDLLPGTYSIRFFEDPKNSPYRSAQDNFKVIAPKGSVVLDLGKDEFLWDEIIPVKVKFPEDVSPDSPGLFFQLVRKGGYVPGCAIQADKVVKEYIALDGKTEHQLQFEDPPGTYILRLYDGSDWNAKSSVIGEAEFKVTTTNLKGAIQIEPGQVFEPTEEIEVNINVPPSVSPEALKDTNLLINYLGYNAPGGSVMQAANGWQADIKWSGNEATVTVKMPEASGFYELWLTKRHNQCVPYDPCIVMDRVPFEVKDSRVPYKSEYGVWGGKPEYNLGEHFPFPPTGEFLDAASCGGPFEIDALKEKMTITFVQWNNGDYAEVKPPIDFGEGFYVQGQLEDEAARESYVVTLSTPEGDEQDIVLFPLEDDPTVVRSERLYLIWHPEGGGE